MAKNDQQEAYDKLMTASLARVIDLVKFAEAKNAGLLAFTSAWVVAIANIMTKDNGPPPLFAWALPISGSIFLICAGLALWSILPQVKPGKLFQEEDDAEGEANLLFFGDISAEAIKDFPARAQRRYLPQAECSTTPAYLADLALQIQVNSKIANRKYKLFQRAAWLAMLSLGILVAPAVWYLLGGAMRLILAAAP